MSDRQSVVFRVENRIGEVIFAEVRNYKKRTAQTYVGRHSTRLLNRFPTGYATYMKYPDRLLQAGVYLDMTKGHTLEVRG